MARLFCWWCVSYFFDCVCYRKNKCWTMCAGHVRRHHMKMWLVRKMEMVLLNLLWIAHNSIWNGTFAFCVCYDNCLWSSILDNILTILYTWILCVVIDSPDCAIIVCYIMRLYVHHIPIKRTMKDTNCVGACAAMVRAFVGNPVRGLKDVLDDNRGWHLIDCFNIYTCFDYYVLMWFVLV